MLNQQLLQQRERKAFVYLRLRGALCAQEITRVEPGGVNALLIEHGGHQARGPDFAVADHFGVNRVGDSAVQQRGQALKIVNKFADKPVGNRGRQQPGDKLALITAQRLLHLMRGETIALA